MKANTNTERRLRLAAWVTAGAVFAVILAGCLTPFRPPPDVAHLRIRAEDSARVWVYKVWLERKPGSPLVVTGHVNRRFRDADTSASHLVVSLRDASGKVLKEEVVYFKPRKVTYRLRPPPASARFIYPLDPLPRDTSEILVTAIDPPG